MGIEYYVTQKPRELSTRVQVPMFYGNLERVDWEYLRLGIAQQDNETRYDSAML